jgi:hypothetical protein
MGALRHDLQDELLPTQAVVCDQNCVTRERPYRVADVHGYYSKREIGVAFKRALKATGSTVVDVAIVWELRSDTPVHRVIRGESPLSADRLAMLGAAFRRAFDVALRNPEMEQLRLPLGGE